MHDHDELTKNKIMILDLESLQLLSFLYAIKLCMNLYFSLVSIFVRTAFEHAVESI